LNRFYDSLYSAVSNRSHTSRWQNVTCTVGGPMPGGIEIAP